MVAVQIIARRTLRQFCEMHPAAEAPLRKWFYLVSKASWQGPADIRAMFNSADFIADNRVIFNVGGSKFRLVVRVSNQFGSVIVKIVGTHADYDDIKAELV